MRLAQTAAYNRRVAIDFAVQRLEIGDVILIDPPDQGPQVEAKVVRAIDRTDKRCASRCAWRDARTSSRSGPPASWSRSCAVRDSPAAMTPSHARGTRRALWSASGGVLVGIGVPAHAAARCRGARCSLPFRAEPHTTGRGPRLRASNGPARRSAPSRRQLPTSGPWSRMHEGAGLRRGRRPRRRRSRAASRSGRRPEGTRSR